MHENDGTEECEVCGGTDFYKEAGHFYCSECQTQSQQIREQVFEQEDETINKKSTRKIQKDKPEKIDEKLTSWECYNIILKGLTEELIGLGAKPDLKVVVKCLWMKYLQKCQVFDVKSNVPPKVSIIGSRKDIAILYNVKKRKRSRGRTSSTSTTMSVKRQRSSKRRALIQSQYEELSQSQTLTQNSSMAASETLTSLKSGSESSDDRKIEYNRYSKAALKGMMSKKHQKEHKHDVAGEMSCHKFRACDFSVNISRGPTMLTTYTLYIILYIGLLIIEDSIQLGDLLRFIKEGHVSFRWYRHFFDEDLSDKSLSLPKTNGYLLGHEYFRKKTADLIRFLKVDKYVKCPDLVGLCSRYCSELNLPREIRECVEKFIIRTAPRMPFEKDCLKVPNYEARAMSFILFTLKLIFSLDGTTEHTFSNFARMVNERQTGGKMFDVLEWLKYIAYRDIVMTTHHIPSALQSCDDIDSDMYLDYIKNQDIHWKSTGGYVQKEVKDYLQIFDKLLDGDHSIRNELKFKHSLTPFLSYSKLILDAKEINNYCEDVLKRTFTKDSIEFLLRPNGYLELLGNQTVKNGGANDKFIIEDTLYFYKNLNDERKYHYTVTVKVCDEIESNNQIINNQKGSLKPTDVGVFLSNWQQGNDKQFSRNRVLLKLASENVTVDAAENGCQTDEYIEHYNPFERYWLNIPVNPAKIRCFSKSRMPEITSKLSGSFKIILKELTRIIEQEVYDFYKEFLMTELNLVYFEGYYSKCKKSAGAEIRNVVKDCLKKW